MSRWASREPESLSDADIEAWAAQIVEQGWLTDSYENVHRLARHLRAVRDMARASDGAGVKGERDAQT